jgi:hypothetical protein
MRKAIGLLTCLLSIFAQVPPGHAQDLTSEYSVQVGATAQASPPQIRLSWPPDHITRPSSYKLYRKRVIETAWGASVSLPGTSTTYVDNDVSVGTAYEYQIVKSTPHYTGYGYLCSGIEVPMTENRGTLLLVVDKTYAAQLAEELVQLQQDLTGDGWVVRRLDVNRGDSVVQVKSLIKAQYQTAPAQVKCVFLFGHVPVPYSGDIAPDGHEPEHRGAWPCDGYYGDMDGVWTDRTVRDTQAVEARNHNVPGDGKFDQSTFPAPLKLMVGRVDLANMPGGRIAGSAAAFPSELELLRNYLRKDHMFRTRQFELPRRGFVGDYFGAHNGEAFAASGWRNFSAMFGDSKVLSLPDQGTWISKLSGTPCLCAYGCGPGTYEYIEGLGNADGHHAGTSAQLVQQDIKAAFVLLYGSWLGDWDAQNNMLRSVLATPSYGLASVWSGRPHWFLHHMALGETIGFGTRLTQNNASDGLYRSYVNTAAGQVHLALMGDPTLRLHYVAPPENLTSTTNDAAITLRWTESNDAVLGYHVYRAVNSDGPYSRLTAVPITCTSFTDRSPDRAASYMVRAVKLESTASGTYFNVSQGALLPGDGASFNPLGPVVQRKPSKVNAAAVKPAAGSG